MTESSRTEVITVSVIDDDANIRNGLSWLLNNIVGLSCLETYTSYPEAQKGLAQKTPDILLLDISLPGISCPPPGWPRGRMCSPMLTDDRTCC